MNLVNKNLVTIDDLSNTAIETLFSLADEMSDSMNKQLGLCQGKVMASLFFEPSTRTRLSFEAAMHRLGGSVISAVEIGATSLSKGESIADMARVVSSYADIIVIRHPWEGAAKVVADYSGVPVINAGDGSHEHPTQTLCDLYTIRKARGTIKGLKIALCGDLKYGRTIHSLTYALARLSAEYIIFFPGHGLELPEHILRKLTTEYGAQLGKKAAKDLPSLVRALGGDDKEGVSLDAIYITPGRPHQLALLPNIDIKINLKVGAEVDALYMTRIQKERFPPGKQEDTKKTYPTVDSQLLRKKEFEHTIIMHPLPRVDELAYELDADQRSMYFKQAARGVPIRMALIALLLGVRKIDIPEEEEPTFVKETNYPVYNTDYGVRCRNRNCVSVQETEKRYIKPEFRIIAEKPLTLRCVYCEHESHPQYVASSEKSKKYHSANSFMLNWIKPEHLIIFDSEEEARQRGFSPGQYAHISANAG